MGLAHVCGPVWPYLFVVIKYSYRVASGQPRLHDSNGMCGWDWLHYYCFLISSRSIQEFAGRKPISTRITLFASSSAAKARPKRKQEFLCEHTSERIHHFIICPPSVSCACVCGAASAADTENQIASQQLRLWARPNREIHNCRISECAPLPLPHNNNMFLLEYNFTYGERERNHVDAGFRLCALDHDTVTNIHTPTPLTIMRGSIAFKWESIHIHNVDSTYVSSGGRVGGREMRIARKVNGQWCRC